MPDSKKLKEELIVIHDNGTNFIPSNCSIEQDGGLIIFSNDDGIQLSCRYEDFRFAQITMR